MFKIAIAAFIASYKITSFMYKKRVQDKQVILLIMLCNNVNIKNKNNICKVNIRTTLKKIDSDIIKKHY